MKTLAKKASMKKSITKANSKSTAKTANPNEIKVSKVAPGIFMTDAAIKRYVQHKDKKRANQL